MTHDLVGALVSIVEMLLVAQMFLWRIHEPIELELRGIPKVDRVRKNKGGGQICPRSKLTPVLVALRTTRVFPLQIIIVFFFFFENFHKEQQSRKQH